MGCTTIVTAHRSVTVQDAHKIYVLDKGWVFEQGTHATLLKHGGRYQKMIESQTTQLLADDREIELDGEDTKAEKQSSM